MESRTKGILEEIMSIDIEHDKKHIIRTRADNIIESAIRIIELMEDAYPEDQAGDLIRKMLNSIRTKDVRKFQRSLQRVNEN
jgi:hypothetical protein